MDPDSDHLRNFISRSSLIDLPFNNGMHTWNNKRSGGHHIASKLDRFLISDNAIHMGGDIIASILPIIGSDHWPIALQWQRPNQHLKQPFRFEAFWLDHPSFKDMVHTSWKSFTPPKGSKMFQFQQKLWFLKSQIKSWNHSVFGKIFQEKKALELKMAEI